MSYRFSLVSLNLFIGFLYAAACICSYALVSPPDGYSIIWLPAGVGFATVFIFGRQTLIGVILAATATHSFYYLDLNSLTATLASSATIFAIVFASVTQIEISCRLIDRYLGLDNPLIGLRDTLLFFFFAGPAGCLIGAICATLMSSFGATSFEYGLEHLLVWWLSNSLAVLILLPLALALFHKPRNNWKIQCVAIVIPLCFCFCVLLYNLFGAVDYENKRLRTSLLDDVEILHRQIEQGFKEKEQVIWTVERMLGANLPQTENFTDEVRTILATFGNITSLAVYERVDHKDRLYYEKNILKGPILTFNEDKRTFTPTINANFYYVAVSLTSSKTIENQFTGLDLLTVPRNTDIIQNVISTKTSKSSRMVLLADSDMNEGNVLVSPVFKGPNSAAYEAESGDVKGFIILTYSTKALINTVLSLNSRSTLDIELLENKKIRFSNVGDRPLGYTEPKWTITRLIDTLGNKWLIRYTPNANFKVANSPRPVWWIAVIGTVLLALIAVTLHLMTGQILGREQVVNKRTNRLRKHIIARDKTNKLQMQANEVLRLIAEYDSLDATYAAIFTLIEKHLEEITVGIYTSSTDSASLSLVAGRNLSAEMNYHLAHIIVAFGNTGLGHCAYTNEPMLVDNIGTHPYWISKADRLSQAGLSSCWAIPITSSRNILLGVLGVYLPTSQLPSEQTLKWLTKIALLTAIAIEKNSAEKKIEYFVNYDHLTQLPNRRLLMTKLRKETNLAIQNYCYGALLFIDLDHFKTLNDSLGHHYGDMLLAQLSDRLKTLATENIVARWGGDELILLIPAYHKAYNAAVSGAMDIADEVRLILEQPFDLSGYYHAITCSIGVTLFHEHNSDCDDILKQADTAMYDAKERGRNCVSMHEMQMQTIANSRLAIEKGLREAIVNNDLFLEYQPQFNQEGTLIAAEALIRWHNVIDSVVGPAEFIGIAEYSNIIVDIGNWVINTACEQLKVWPSLPVIAINIGLKQFYAKDFITTLQLCLTKNNLSGERIIVEISEQLIMENISETIRIMQQLHDLKVRISIDNFGTGYSSLIHIKLPIDQLKIDNSLIHTIDQGSNTIIESIMYIAKKFHCEVAAAGVETQVQFEYLRKHQCEVYQGYLLSYPLGEKEFSKLLSIESEDKSI
jgi:diguanylate cyclase (GGDEF)-like protein